MNKLNLFCLPFAGGSKYSYNSFVSNAPKNIHIIPIEIPGRGGRYKEQLLKNIHDIVDDVFSQIKGKLHAPYAIYGHSMGSLLGYLLTKKILINELPPPIHLFFTGASAPSKPKSSLLRYLMPKADFIEELRDLGGSPHEILADDSLMDFFEPILRADFQVVETYSYEETEPFDIPISVVIGTDEKVSYKDAQNWEQESTCEVSIQQFPGDHFFIFNYVPEIIKLINQSIEKK